MRRKLSKQIIDFYDCEVCPFYEQGRFCKYQNCKFAEDMPAGIDAYGKELGEKLSLFLDGKEGYATKKSKNRLALIREY